MDGNNDDGYVSHATCAANVKLMTEKIENVEQEAKKTNKALFGEDGTGGIVKTINTMENRGQIINQLFDMVKAVVISVITACIILRFVSS